MADRYNYQLTIEGDMSESDRKWVDIYCEGLTCADESEQLYFGFDRPLWEYEDDLENLSEYLPGRQMYSAHQRACSGVPLCRVRY